MSLVGWALGWLALIGIISGIVSAAWGLQRRYLPDWHGAQATLAGAVIGTGLLLGIAQVLGVLGLLHQATLLVAAAAAGVLLRPKKLGAPPSDAASPPFADQDSASPTWNSTVGLLAVAATALLVVNWLTRTVAVYRYGSSDGDSLMYHLPFATRFVQTGSITEVPSIGPDPWVAFYPANVELLQATAILPHRHVAILPLLNLGWVALGLLAAWCLGQRAGRGHLGILLGATVLTLPVMVATNSGTGRVDIAASALLLATLALLVQEPRTTTTCFLAGLALGMALGTKLSIVPTAGVLVLGATAVLLWRRTPRQAAAFGGGTLLLSSVWLIRNWVVAGNPLPMLDLKLGPIGFSALDDERVDRLEGTALVDHVSSRSWDFVYDTGLPALDFAYGSRLVTAALVLTALAGIVGILRLRPIGMLHVIVLALIGTCAAYPFSPNSAGYVGQGGDPISIVIVALNTRYLMPGLLAMMCVVTLALPRTRASWLPTALGSAALALVAFSTYRGLVRDEAAPGTEWPVDPPDIALGLALTVVMALLGYGILVFLRRQNGLLAGPVAAPLACAGVAVLALAPFSWIVAERHWLNRYDAAEPEVAALWAQVHDLPSGQRIAVMGEWLQQPYAGDDLGNEVRYLGSPANQGLFHPPHDCLSLQQTLQVGNYDLAVAQSGVMSFSTRDEIQWLTSIPDAEVLAQNAQGVLVRLPSQVEVPCAGES